PSRFEAGSPKIMQRSEAVSSRPNVSPDRRGRHRSTEQPIPYIGQGRGDETGSGELFAARIAEGAPDERTADGGGGGAIGGAVPDHDRLSPEVADGGANHVGLAGEPILSEVVDPVEALPVAQPFRNRADVARAAVGHERDPLARRAQIPEQLLRALEEPAVLPHFAHLL